MDIWGTDTFVKFERKNCSFEVKDGCLTVTVAYWEGDGEGGETEGEAEVTLGVEETEIVTIMLAEDAVKRGENGVKTIYEPSPFDQDESRWVIDDDGGWCQR